MLLSQLDIQQFRCHDQIHLALSPAGIKIIGANASGKTSLLEAVGMLATTRSLRGAADIDVVKWESGAEYGVAAFSRIDAVVHTDGRDRRLSISIELAEDADRVQQKRFLLDNRPTTAHQLVGHLRAVMFTPEDVQLVTGPPSDRRRMVDVLISQLDQTYMRQLSAYGRILRQRNSLLKAFARDRVQPTATPAVTQLSFWDEQLVAAGGYLVARRARTIHALDGAMRKQAARHGEPAPVGLAYLPRTLIPASVSDVDGNLANAVVSSNHALQQDIENRRTEEFRRGMTLAGPHRDDITFEIGERSLARFGSRGEQRLGVLALKLAEADVIRDETGESPVFLLDDILSELDESHRSLLLDQLASHGAQRLITTADEAAFDHPSLSDLDEFHAESTLTRD